MSADTDDTRPKGTEPPPALESVPPGVLLQPANPCVWLGQMLAELSRRHPREGAFDHFVSVGIVVQSGARLCERTHILFTLDDLVKLSSPAAAVDEIEARIRKNDEEAQNGT
jgi:hypothetical protein